MTGTDNPADINTKHVSQKIIDKALIKVELKIVSGRAESGLTVSGLVLAGSSGCNSCGTVGAAAVDPPVPGGEEERENANWVVYNGRWGDQFEEELAG